MTMTIEGIVDVFSTEKTAQSTLDLDSAISLDEIYSRASNENSRPPI